jgi:hypothetical protein
MPVDTLQTVSYLNRNAAAIQAVSAAVTTAVTIVLAIGTWKYVRLTKRLADVAAAQLQFQQDAETAKWRELWGLLKLVRRIVADLPDETRRAGFDKDIRQSIPWEQSDLARFQALAAQLGTIVGSNAAIAVSSIMWLGERITEVKAVPIQQGYDYDRRFHFDRWFTELHRARDRIEDVATPIKERLGATAQ